MRLVLISLISIFFVIGCDSSSEVQNLIQQLKSSDSKTVPVQKLAALKEKAVPAIPDLQKLLLRKKSSFTLKNNIIHTLTQIGPESLPTLILALEDTNALVRSAVVKGIKSFRDKGKIALPSLLKTLEDKDSDVRSETVEALAYMGKDALPALYKACSDKKWQVRKNAVESLEKLTKNLPEASNQLAKLLNDEQWRVRMAVAKALSRVGVYSDPLMEQLLKSLQDSDHRVHPYAAKAIESILPDNVSTIQHSDVSITLLIDSLGSNHGKVKKIARECLEVVNKDILADTAVERLEGKEDKQILNILHFVAKKQAFAKRHHSKLQDIRETSSEDIQKAIDKILSE